MGMDLNARQAGPLGALSPKASSQLDILGVATQMGGGEGLRVG
jgi:hypothetical protein